MVLIKSRPDYEGAEKYIINLLETRLPPNAPYYTGGELEFHHIRHTYDVSNAGEELLREHKRLGGRAIEEEELKLFRLGLKSHDIGYTVSYDNHEKIGTKMITYVFPDFGFNSERIWVMCGMVMASKMPQRPQEGNILQYMMCDSDVVNFGRTGKDGFLPMTHRLKKEVETVNGIELPLVKWYEDGLNLLEGHKYFSDAGKSLGNEGKARNLEELKRRLGKLYSNPEEHAELERQFLKSEIID